MNPRSPTLRAQALGNKLRDLRTAAGLDLADAAQHVRRDKSGISRMETGVIPMPADVLDELLTLYGVHQQAERDSLARFNKEAWRTGWWAGYADEVVASLIDYVWIEERATTIRSFNNAGINGLLQTPDYARALMFAFNPDEAPDQVESWVDLRLRRQVILTRAKAPRLSALLSEAALRNHVGGTGVLAEQLHHVVDRAQRDNIEVRALPFTAGVQASHASDIQVFEMPPPFPEVAAIEGPTDITYLEPPATAPIIAAYARLEDAALDPDESTALILSIAKDLEAQSP